jgi:hypothetical protein
VAATVVAARPATPTRPASAPAPSRSRGAIFAAAAVVVVLAIGGTALLTGLVKLPSSLVPTPAAGTPGTSASPSASPGPIVLRDVAIDKGTTLTRGDSIRVSGHGLGRGAHPSAGFQQGAQVHPISGTDLIVNPDGSFVGDGVVPADLRPGNATLLACPNQGPATGGCIGLPVTIR